MPSFKCKDIGMKCNFEVKTGGSEDELMSLIALHADKSHNMKPPFPADMTEKIKKAIKK